MVSNEANKKMTTKTMNAAFNINCDERSTDYSTDDKDSKSIITKFRIQISFSAFSYSLSYTISDRFLSANSSSPLSLQLLLDLASVAIALV